MPSTFTSRGAADDPRADVRRGYEAYRAFYDVLPATFEACSSRCSSARWRRPGGTLLRRARAPSGRRRSAAAMRAARRRGDGLPHHALQRLPPRRRLAGDAHPARLRQLAGSARGFGARRLRRETACRRSTSRWSGCRGTTPGAWLSRTPTSAHRGGSCAPDARRPPLRAARADPPGGRRRPPRARERRR